MRTNTTLNILSLNYCRTLKRRDAQQSYTKQYNPQPNTVLNMEMIVKLLLLINE